MKTFYQKIIFLSLVIVFAGCGNDDESISGNRPPGEFQLLEVPNQTTGVKTTPTFSWESAVDPDGDDIRYSLYIGTESDPQNLIASELTETSFTLTEKLSLSEDYYWKVIASDGKGGVTGSEVFTFQTRSINKGTLAFDNMPFSKRSRHHIIVKDNRVYLLGGLKIVGTSITPYPEVWVSDTMGEWELLNSDVEPLARINSDIVYFQNKYWIFGGNDFGTIINDIWSSTNLTHWELRAQEASFNAGQAVVNYKNKLIMAALDKFWLSDDGLNWEEHLPGFEIKSPVKLFEFKDSLWMIQGYNGGVEIWKSDNGLNWDFTGIAPFGIEDGYTPLLYDDKIWLIGGFSSNYQSEIWATADGIEWINYGIANFSERGYYGATVFDDKIWIIDGTERNGNHFNDIWVMD